MSNRLTIKILETTTRSRDTVSVQEITLDPVLIPYSNELSGKFEIGISVDKANSSDIIATVKLVINKEKLSRENINSIYSNCVLMILNRSKIRYHIERMDGKYNIIIDEEYKRDRTITINANVRDYISRSE